MPIPPTHRLRWPPAQLPGPVAALIVGCLLGIAPAPASADDDWLGADKGMHYGASLIITAGGHGLSALVLEEPWQRAVVGASLGMTAGIAKELHDLAGHGDPSWKDIAWDVAGVASGVGLALLVEALLAEDDPAPARAAPAALTIRF